MASNKQGATDLVTFAEEILNGKLHFLCSGGVFRTLSMIMVELFAKIVSNIKQYKAAKYFREKNPS